MKALNRLGRYRLVAELGRGGKAELFLAIVDGPRGSGFAKVAVVKRLRPNLAEDPECISMLLDEGRLTARLSHPNIVQIFEAERDGDDYFLAMEHLDGQPLHLIQERAAKTGIPIPQSYTFAVVADTLSALHYAHEFTEFDGSPSGIIHRDVTPRNIFVTYEGVVKVVDFGMGRLFETQGGFVKGKLNYRSPEQAAGVELDRRADIFAVGVLLYEAVAGRRLWGDRSGDEIARALIDNDYDPSPQSVDPSVSDELDALCRRALAHRPADRFATAAEMLASLEKALGGLSARRRELGTFVGEMFLAERRTLRQVLGECAGKQAASLSDLGLDLTIEDQPDELLTIVVGSPTKKASPVAPPSVAPITMSLALQRPASASTRTRKKAERARPSSSGARRATNLIGVFCAVSLMASLLVVGLVPSAPPQTAAGPELHRATNLRVRFRRSTTDDVVLRKTEAPIDPVAAARTTGAEAGLDGAPGGARLPRADETKSQDPN